MLEVDDKRMIVGVGSQAEGKEAALGMFYPTHEVLDEATRYLTAIRIIAKLPTMVAAFARLRRGDESIQPRDDLSYAENFLYMLTEQIPDPSLAKIFDVCLILHAEHTMNASTFSGMVTASTLALKVGNENFHRAGGVHLPDSLNRFCKDLCPSIGYIITID